MPCACCTGCLSELEFSDLLITPSGALTDGTCDNCQGLVDDFWCPYPDYRMFYPRSGRDGCIWLGCCGTNPCQTYHDDHMEECGGATVAAMQSVLTDTPGTNSGRKVTLEFIMSPDSTCSGTAELMARYELDDIDPSTNDGCGLVLPLVTSSGACGWPATMTLTCSGGDGEPICHA